jgi:hypothetical protein
MQVVYALLENFEFFFNYFQEHVVFESNKETIDDVSDAVESFQESKPSAYILAVFLLLLKILLITIQKFPAFVDELFAIL